MSSFPLCLLGHMPFWLRDQSFWIAGHKPIHLHSIIGQSTSPCRSAVWIDSTSGTATLRPDLIFESEPEYLVSHCVPLCPIVSHCVPLCPIVSHCVPLLSRNQIGHLSVIRTSNSLFQGSFEDVLSVIHIKLNAERGAWDRVNPGCKPFPATGFASQEVCLQHYEDCELWVPRHEN
jgi:hypothetical protein